VKNSTHATLLERLRDGADALAWDDFCRRYGRLIFMVARQRGCAEHTAEEIVQEVLLAVFQQREVFRYDPARGRFRDWLARVVRNQVARHRRGPAERVRAAGGEDEALDPAADLTPADAAWEAAFEETLLLALLEVVRSEVTPETYQAFELLTLGELPGAEVAALTGLSRNAVYLARQRVQARLRELGASYREAGQLDERLQAALRTRPNPAVVRALTSRLEQSRPGSAEGP